jgi:orotate phosphoribosyltransferase
MAVNINNNVEEKLVNFLFEEKAIQIGNFTLSSGKKSMFYIDMRVIQSHPLHFRYSISLLKRYILNKIGLESFDYICSLPTSGTIFGITLAYELFKPHIYIRKSQKNYGTNKNIEGNLIYNSRILLIDDVITTGHSLTSAIEALKNYSRIKDVLVFINRSNESENVLKSFNVQLNQILSSNTIFDTLFKNKRINKDELDKLKHET